MYKNFSAVYDYMMEYADYNGWAEMVESKINSFNEDSKTLLDLGCGTGEVLIRLAHKYKVTGVDLSKEMVSIASRKIDNIPFFIQDMRELTLDLNFDVIISLFDTVNHLTSIEDLEKTFTSAFNTLNKNGLYIFDIATRDLIEEMFPGGNYIDDRENIVIVWEHEKEQNLDYITTTFFVKQENGLYKKIREEYTKKIFRVDEVINVAKKIGFKVLEVEENINLAGKRVFFTLTK